MGLLTAPHQRREGLAAMGNPLPVSGSMCCAARHGIQPSTHPMDLVVEVNGLHGPSLQCRLVVHTTIKSFQQGAATASTNDRDLVHLH